MIAGRLEAFADMGTEGYFWSFQEEGKSGYDGLHFLEAGDHLTIYSDDGAVLFSGVLKPTPNSQWAPPGHPAGQPTPYPNWDNWTQEGWNPVDWMIMFCNRPRAELTRKGTENG
jgi:hypothetical protein